MSYELSLTESSFYPFDVYLLNAYYVTGLVLDVLHTKWASIYGVFFHHVSYSTVGWRGAWHSDKIYWEQSIIIKILSARNGNVY